MDEAAQVSQWGSLALVSYLPDSLRSCVNELRRSLIGEDVPEAHVTILPRRPLAVPIEVASEQVLKLLPAFRSFPVELSNVRCFRQTSVLYLDIGEGSARLHALHDSLDRGDLAYGEEFPFRPHLTLGCAQCVDDMDRIRTRAKLAWDAAPVNRRFLLHEIVCLWLPPDGSPRDWRRLWSFDLKTRQVTQTPPLVLAATSQTC